VTVAFELPKKKVPFDGSVPHLRLVFSNVCNNSAFQSKTEVSVSWRSEKVTGLTSPSEVRAFQIDERMEDIVVGICRRSVREGCDWEQIDVRRWRNNMLCLIRLAGLIYTNAFACTALHASDTAAV
jgi:hypothetical protein